MAGSVAVVALLVAFVALINPAGSDGQPVAAGNQQTATATGGDPPARPTTAGSNRVEPSNVAGSSGAQPTSANTESVRPEADFEPVFERQKLTLVPPASCSDDPRYIDVDEPRVGVAASSAEFKYEDVNCSGKPKLDITDGLPVSAASDTATARDCAEAIRNAPINELVVPTNETNICLATSAEQAQNEGISRKIVLIVVESVSPEHVLVVSVTAWSVPD